MPAEEQGRLYGEEPVCKHSGNRHLGDLLPTSGLGRRAFVKGGLGMALGAFVGTSVTACGESSNAAPSQIHGRSRLNFAAVPVGRGDQVVLPPGYRAQVLLPWGTPLLSPTVGDDKAGSKASEQESQVGSHHDGMHFFSMPPAAGRRYEGLLVINHEYVDPNVLHPQGPSGAELRPLAEVRMEMAAHGLSIAHLACDKNGHWELLRDSRYNRRITASTPMEIRGPLRGSPKLVTPYSPDASRARGTLNNCSGGVTPWNTWLMAEENWDSYFVNRDAELPREHSRYAIAREHGRYRWDEAETPDDLCQRFDASRRAAEATQDWRNEPNSFGWMVEVDPFDPDHKPIKRTALGRFAHEGVVFAKPRIGEPLVCYSGDDAKHEYIYKFVSARPYSAEADGSWLDEGTLYAARFDEDGRGRWLALDINNREFRERAAKAGLHFENQADVLLNTRFAADVAGATKMDRPEWGAVHPSTGEVYFTLTNNDQRTEADAANPRVHNECGHIIRWREGGGEAYALDFDWDIFLLAGEVDTSTPSHPERVLTEDNHFASPDGLWFDPTGLMWLQTDMAGTQRSKGPFGNNQMLVADPVSGEIKRFLTGPVECEITGITATPDMRTLFVNIQHPGEQSLPGNFTSHWPDGGNARPRSATIAISREDGGVIPG